MMFYTSDQMLRARRIIGLMSGTSVDGIDAAAVEISGAGDDVSARLAAFLTVPMDEALRGAIHAAFGARGDAASLTALDAALGLAFADAALEVVMAAGWSRADVDAVGSHGQTVWHQPDPVEVAGAFVSGTLQLGNAAIIAERVRTPVVSDFRSRDMAAGGQGAPLVPMADWLFYRQPGRNRVVLNIGGIANITWLPARGDSDDVIAFDTGPGNMAVDAAVATITGGRQAWDEDGCLAAAGTVRDDFLSAWLCDEFFHRAPPRSTGRERFGAMWARERVSEMRATGFSDADVVATLTALTAESVARALRDHLPAPPDEVVVGGGGAHNRALMAMLAKRITAPVLPVEALGFHGDAKEAVAFAALADRTMQGLPGNVPSATGAARAVVLGSVTPSR